MATPWDTMNPKCQWQSILINAKLWIVYGIRTQDPSVNGMQSQLSYLVKEKKEKPMKTSPEILVTQLGFGPRTPSLKGMCSTS